jgi:hypothetical protein
MVALAVGGTPTTSLIGTNENNLNWVVNQPSGESSHLDRRFIKAQNLLLG